MNPRKRQTADLPGGRNAGRHDRRGDPPPIAQLDPGGAGPSRAGLEGAGSYRRQDEPGTPTLATAAEREAHAGGARRHHATSQGFRAAAGQPATHATGQPRRRADPRIREDVEDLLSDDAFVDASEIEVQVADGEVELSGRVPAGPERDRAADLAARVAGVLHVTNRLAVGGSNRP